MSMDRMNGTDLRGAESSDASIDVLLNVREVARPRVEYPLMFVLFVSSPAVGELRMPKPRSARQVNVRRRDVDDCCSNDTRIA